MIQDRSGQRFRAQECRFHSIPLDPISTRTEPRFWIPQSLYTERLLGTSVEPTVDRKEIGRGQRLSDCSLECGPKLPKRLR